MILQPRSFDAVVQELREGLLNGTIALNHEKLNTSAYEEGYRSGLIAGSQALSESLRIEQFTATHTVRRFFFEKTVTRVLVVVFRGEQLISVAGDVSYLKNAADIRKFNIPESWAADVAAALKLGS